MEKAKFQAAAAALLAAMAGVAQASPYNLPKGVTELTQEVYGLHMLIFWIVCGIGVVVFGAMIYSIFAHRKSRHPKPADFHESIPVEIAWTVIPFIILIGMAIPAAGTLIKMEDTENSEFTIKVTGYQWKWQYEYIDQDIDFFSTLSTDSNEARQLGSGVDVYKVDNYLLDVDKPLVLPVGAKVRLLLTSNDVIHAWWVPEVTGKKDAIPGYINKMWIQIEEPGVYRGQGAELCGRDHGFMPIVVEALPREEFEAWVAEQGGRMPGEDAGPPQMASAARVAAADIGVASEAGMSDAGAGASEPVGDAPAADQASLMEQGETVYGNYCSACHQANGQGMAAANFPALVDSPIVTGPADAQIQQILQGKGAMPAFGYLSDMDIASVITYTRNSWGNDAGVVTPADVAAQR